MRGSKTSRTSRLPRLIAVGTAAYLLSRTAWCAAPQTAPNTTVTYNPSESSPDTVTVLKPAARDVQVRDTSAAVANQSPGSMRHDPLEQYSAKWTGRQVPNGCAYTLSGDWLDGKPTLTANGGGSTAWMSWYDYNANGKLSLSVPPLIPVGEATKAIVYLGHAEAGRLYPVDLKPPAQPASSLAAVPLCVGLRGVSDYEDFVVTGSKAEHTSLGANAEGLEGASQPVTVVGVGKVVWTLNDKEYDGPAYTIPDKAVTLKASPTPTDAPGFPDAKPVWTLTTQQNLELARGSATLGFKRTDVAKHTVNAACGTGVPDATKSIDVYVVRTSVVRPSSPYGVDTYTSPEVPCISLVPGSEGKGTVTVEPAAATPGVSFAKSQSTAISGPVSTRTTDTVTGSFTASPLAGGAVSGSAAVYPVVGLPDSPLVTGRGMDVVIYPKKKRGALVYLVTLPGVPQPQVPAGLTDAAIKTSLNSIYKPAAMEWTVEVRPEIVDFDVNDNGVLDVGGGPLPVTTDELTAIFTACPAEAGVDNIYVVLAPVSCPRSCANSRRALIFDGTGSTIPHEVGHLAFSLSDLYDTTAGTGCYGHVHHGPLCRDLDNLMNEGWDLRTGQWDVIQRAPGSVLAE